MNPLVHVLRGTPSEKQGAVTSIDDARANVAPENVASPCDDDKIGFTLDVAMRLAAERLPNQDDGSPLSYIEREMPPHLADSA